MKRNNVFLFRILSAALCALMLLSASVPAMAAGEDPLVLVKESHAGTQNYDIEYVYNAKGQLIQKTERGETVIDYTYYGNGNLKEEVCRVHNTSYSGNIRYRKFYRQDGTMARVLENVFGSDGTQTTATTVLFDGKGNPTSESLVIYHKVSGSNRTVPDEPSLTTYENTYDESGRLVSRFTSSDTDPLMIQETWWYDGETGSTTWRKEQILQGRLNTRETTVTDAAGNVLMYLQDTRDGYPIHYADYYLYDGQGNLTFQEHSEHDIASGGVFMGVTCGATTHYTNVYRDGLLTQTLKSGSWYSYDGQTMEQHTEPSHTSASFTYNTAGQMLTAKYTDVNGNVLSTKTWQYDAQGNLTKYEDTASGTVTYTYLPLSKAQGK